MNIKKINDIIKIYKSENPIILERKIIKLLEEFPLNHILYNLYGAVLLDQKKVDLSIIQFKKSININKNYAEAYNNLASAYLKQDDLNESKKNFEKSIKIKPNFKQPKISLSNIYTFLGNISLKNSNYSSAIINYKKAIEINSNSFDAYNNLGCVLEKEKKYVEAITNFNKAILINPDQANSYYNLGNVFRKMGKYEKSIFHFNKSIEKKPNYVESFNNLGNIYLELGQIDESIKYYKNAIKLKSDYENALNNLSNIFKDVGDYDEARKCYESLIKINPNNIKYHINNELMIVPIYQTNEEIKYFRDRYYKGIKKLINHNYQTIYPGENIRSNLFYLAYHNKNNLNIMMETSKLFKKIIPNINFISQKIKNNENKKKIKIGFISEYLTYHSIGKIFGGFIKKLNKEKFSIYIIHTKDTKKNFLKDKIDKYADKVIELNLSIKEQQKQIENECLDIIFYPDIGMSPTTYFLAYSRLAPVQIVSWGHTETTGIDTIDYFLSSTLFEKKCDEKMYSERLICLSQFPTFYEPFDKIGKEKKRSDFNLPLNKNLYGCLQTFFKIHPDFDSIMEQILKKDKNGYIVFATDSKKDKFWLKLIKKRWSIKFPILNERTLILNKMPYSDYMYLCKCLDVLLTPPYFASGTTALETMMFGTPNITLEGSNLRSRLTSAVYKQMKMKQAPIAKNIDEYVNLAVSLAQNKQKIKV